MSEELRHPVLYLIACGAEPAGDLEPFIRTCQEQGWDVWPIATSSALRFIDNDALAELTGHAVRVDYKRPEEADIVPPPGAIAVAPASFNTINKLAYGNCDTFALELLNEAIGIGLPIVAVPAPTDGLAKHPAFAESIARLRSWGVTVLHSPVSLPFPTSDTEQTRADPVPWRAAEEVLSAWMRFARLPAPGAKARSAVSGY